MITVDRPAVNLRRLFWVSPATVTVSVLAVLAIQWIASKFFDAPRFSPLASNEPAIFTAVLVSGAVVVFAVVGSELRNLNTDRAERT